MSAIFLVKFHLATIFLLSGRNNKEIITAMANGARKGFAKYNPAKTRKKKNKTLIGLFRSTAGIKEF